MQLKGNLFYIDSCRDSFSIRTFSDKNTAFDCKYLGDKIRFSGDCGVGHSSLNKVRNKNNKICRSNWFTLRCFNIKLILNFDNVNLSQNWLYIQVLWRKDACIQLKFHAIYNHQVYYLYYFLKITKTYVKIKSSIIHQIMKSKI